MSEPVLPHVELGVGILAESSGVLAVWKPPGLATQAVIGIDSLEARVRALLACRGDGSYLGIPHRLDRPVSGVLLFATSRRAARKLARQFERRQIVKRYAALLEVPGSGNLPAAGDLWVDLLAKVPDEPRGWLAAPSDPAAKEARTRVVSVARQAAAAVVELEPETGRMHQLRIQSAARGMPILGDRLYGSTHDMPGAGEGLDPRARAIALTATSIEYLDPEDNQPRRVTARPIWQVADE